MGPITPASIFNNRCHIQSIFTSVVTTHSGLSSFHFSFRIEHSIQNDMSIRIHVNFGTISSWNETWSEIDVYDGQNEDFFCKIESFIHVLKCISAKIAETIRGSVHKSRMIFNPEFDFDLSRSFNPQSNLSCKHGLNSKCRSGLKLNPDSYKLYLNRTPSLNFEPSLKRTTRPSLLVITKMFVM